MTSNEPNGTSSHPNAADLNLGKLDLIRSVSEEALRGAQLEAGPEGARSNSLAMFAREQAEKLTSRMARVLDAQAVEEVMGNPPITAKEIVESLKEIWNLQRELLGNIERVREAGGEPSDGSLKALEDSNRLLKSAFEDSELKGEAINQAANEIRESVGRTAARVQRDMFERVTNSGESVYQHVGSGWGYRSEVQPEADGGFSLIITLQNRSNTQQLSKGVFDKVGNALIREVRDLVTRASEFPMSVEVERVVPVIDPEDPSSPFRLVSLGNKNGGFALETKAKFTIGVGREYLS